MSYVASPKDIAEEVRLFAVNLRRNLKDAEKGNIRAARTVAERLSMGPYSLDQLARMGHPYSRRRPRPPMDPGVINRQTGRFLRAYRTDQKSSTNDVITSNLSNVSPEWRYLKHGTKRMIARPLGRLVAKAIAKQRLRALQEAVRRTIHP